jgi:hypothetical protein
MNQLPVSAIRSQHWPQICFEKFILQKQTKLLLPLQPIGLEKKISTNLESSELKDNFDVCLTKYKTINFCLIKLATSMY